MFDLIYVGIGSGFASWCRLCTRAGCVGVWSLDASSLGGQLGEPGLVLRTPV